MRTALGADWAKPATVPGALHGDSGPAFMADDTMLVVAERSDVQGGRSRRQGQSGPTAHSILAARRAQPLTWPAQKRSVARSIICRGL